MQRVDDIGEDALIELFAADPVVPGPRLIVANGDDAAAFMMEPKDASVITTDTMVEGVHFDLAYTRPNDVGRKLMAVNLSDLAAMGARPKYALLSITLNGATPVELVKGIAAGVREQARAHKTVIIGGNTTKIDGPMVLGAVLIGRAEPDEIIRRRGTQHGDAIFVTGSLGNAHAGLKLAMRGIRADDANRALWSALVDPVPRVAAGRALAKARLVHAMCDVSDGLGRDLPRLLVPEGLGARIEAHQLPVSAALRAYGAAYGETAELIAIAGGEDYELLFTADPHDERDIKHMLAETATPVTRIGTVTATPEIEVFMPDGSVITPPSGFDHFKGA